MTGHTTQITVAETDRLVLRRFTPEDAGFVLRLLNEPSFIQNIGDKGIRTLEQAAAILRSCRDLPRLSRIVAFVSPGNAASIRVLHKLGFSFAGMTKLDPAAPDVSLYSLPLPDDSARAGRGQRDRPP